MGQCNCANFSFRRLSDDPKRWTPARIFETCEVRETSDKGNCFFTLIDLHRGDVVFREAPLFSIFRSEDPTLFDMIAEVCTSFNLEWGFQPLHFFGGYKALTTLPPESLHLFNMCFL